MENPQMGMPAEMATQGPNPDEMAIYDQMRQGVSPQEFSNEMLAGASQVDPQAVAEFTEELRSLDVSPEELDALNDLVDQILANPEQYDQLRQQFLAQGMPDDILPEQFDPYFFAALNMAVDQMIAAPTGVQAFAQGGIAELKPIAKAIASYGRNGDTMLAHITPAEARMLRRRGGSGTINPHTGLPEFFLKKAFKSIGKAVKKFASSTIGRIVTTVALSYFLGPLAAQAMGIASGTMAAAAVSGFVGGAGGSLLAGGNLKDALKSGAIAGITAGAAAGLGGARLMDAAPVVDAPAAVPGLNASGSSVVPGAPAISATGEVANMATIPTPDVSSAAYDLNMQAQQAARMGAPSAPATAVTPAPMYDPATATRAVDYGYTPGGAGSTAAYKPTTIGESFSKMGEGLGLGDKPASFDTFKQGAGELFSPTRPSTAEIDARAVEMMGKNPKLPFDTAVKRATAELSPGLLRTYVPAAVAGTGIMALAGGFESKPVQGGPITQSLMKTADQRIREKGLQRQMYMQGLPGVVYDEFGAPVFGQSTRLPTYDVPDYNYGGFNMPGAGGQGGMDLPPVYIPPSGAIGSGRVEQPYNNSDMYSNIMPRRYADGGDVQYYSNGGVAETTDIFKRVLGRDPTTAEFERWQPIFSGGMDVKKWTGFTEDPTIATEQRAYNIRYAEDKAATEAAQLADRTRVAQEKAMRRAAGSGNMYANINAGLSALAPETNPMDTADTTFGARNRQAQMDNLQQTYGPMLQGQRSAMDQQKGILSSSSLPWDVSGYSGQDKAELYRGLARQGLTDTQIRSAAEARYGMQTDADWQALQNAVADRTLYTDRPGGTVGGGYGSSPVTAPPTGYGSSPVTAPPTGYGSSPGIGDGAGATTPANIQEDYKNFFASTKPGSYTDFAGGVLYRVPEYQSGKDSEGRPVKQTMAVFYTPDGREYTLTDKTDLNAIAYTIPEIANEWKKQYGFTPTGQAPASGVMSSDNWNPIRQAYADANRDIYATDKDMIFDKQLRGIDLSQYQNNRQGAFEKLATDVYGGKNMALSDLSRLEAAVGATGKYEPDPSAPGTYRLVSDPNKDAAPEEVKNFIQWQMTQANPFGQGTLADLYAKQGITDPYNNPLVQQQAQGQLKQQDRRDAMYSATQMGLDPTLAHSPQGYGMWEDPNWMAKQTAGAAATAQRGQQQAAAAPNVTVGGGIAGAAPAPQPAASAPVADDYRQQQYNSINQFLATNPSQEALSSAMQQYGVDQAMLDAAKAQGAGFAAGGIASLAQGGYPRRNGQISGPGTEKSDSIPAMLSDGEFVMTAKAVRGAGKGSRRAGAKQMYKLMHQLEKNAERG